MVNVKQSIIYTSMETEYPEEKKNCKTSNVHIAFHSQWLPKQE